MTDAAPQWDGVGEELLRRLKGAPLSVLIALIIYGEQGRPQLVARTGWSRGAVSAALDALVAMDLARRTHFRAWALREGLEPASLLQLAAHEQAPEGTPEGLSDAERAFDAANAERTPEGSWQLERMPQSLWDAESPSDGSWAERLSDGLSQNEGPSDDPSTFLDDQGMPAERPRGGPSAPERTISGLSTFEDDQGMPAERPRGGPSAPERTISGPSTFQDDQGMPAERSRGGPSAAERTMNGRSAPHHDVVGEKTHNIDHLDHHEQHPSHQDTESASLLPELQRLDPPFDNAEAWLRRVPLQLVEAWLDHLQDMGRERRRPIRNEAAFLRAKVESGRWPPMNRRDRRRRPCPDCGKAIRDAQGKCLVCAGIVMV